VGNASRSSLRRADGAAIRVLIVEDEPSLADLLALVLSRQGWQVATRSSGREAIETARSFRPDAVLLDLGLSDIDGLDVLARLRSHDPNLAVVILTARDDAGERTAAAIGGAADYLTKPFGVDDVLGRIGVALRRHGMKADDTSVGMTIGDLYIDVATREVRRGDTEIVLSATEFELLIQLATDPGVSLSKAQIIDRVWHYDFGARSHIVELSIAALRQKVDADRAPMIHTVGEGEYALRAVDPADTSTVVQLNA
jgi:two-component system OmpR family response regulator